jgi:mRNA interferase RelE/StbE
MAYEVVFMKDAQEDFAGLDKSVRAQAIKKAAALQENPFLGDPVGNKFGLDLTGYYKLYIVKKAYRIVYRLVGEEIEVIEIVGIGKRHKRGMSQKHTLIGHLSALLHSLHVVHTSFSLLLLASWQLTSPGRIMAP